jgi:hypothetical protein
VQITPVLPEALAATLAEAKRKEEERKAAEPRVIGKCGSSECRVASRAVRNNDEIVEVRCTAPRYCNILYHLRCWRSFEKGVVPSATAAGSMAVRSRVPCPTPDCTGFI